MIQRQIHEEEEEALRKEEDDSDDDHQSTLQSLQKNELQNETVKSGNESSSAKIDPRIDNTRQMASRNETLMNQSLNKSSQS